MFYRGRRLRKNKQLRGLVRETTLHPDQMVMPYFVVETDDDNFSARIEAMPGQYQLSPQQLELKLERAVGAGLKACLLFGIPAVKDEAGSQAWNDDGIIQKTVRRIKKRFPDLIVITDICLCEYTSHGHCGLLDQNGRVLNDSTLELLQKIALSHARAGADIVAPSDMMDGRVMAIRSILDQEGFLDLPIMSYAVKYASSFYGPFRHAAKSAPAFGDRRTYQMDSANSREAELEALADESEGADMLIVKPAGPCLDIIHRVRQASLLPLVAYQVSGEYAMLKAAGRSGWIDETACVVESLTAVKRAGADIIISYFTEELLIEGRI